jgi:hypothetical protein
MSWRGSSDERHTMTTGCLFALASAAMTCVMLFINGSVVMAVLTILGREGPSWISNQKFSQFVLFLAPVLLTVVEWMMLDYVRTRFSTSRSSQ